MERFKKVKLASILGITCNAFLLMIKSIIGVISGSQAMLADAFNSATDIIASIMTFIGNKIASEPSDDDHNLGHGKAEYIYSMLISIVMLLMAFSVFKDSFLSIIEQNKYTFSIWLVIVCMITIIVKFCLFVYTNKVSKKYNNLLLKANSKDHRNDCIITLFNLLSTLFAINNIYFFDGIVGIGIALWILITSIHIFKESYDILMDKSVGTETKNKVFEIINEHKEIENVIHFNSTPVGYQYQISFTICVDGNMSTFKSHDIANKLEKEISTKMKEIYLTVIHVNPVEKNVKKSTIKRKKK